MSNQADKSLKVWLKMEEGTGATLNDVLKTNNATLNGGVTWVAGGMPAREGKYCIAVDGVLGSYGIIENSNGEVWNGSSSFTVAGWFNRTGDNAMDVAQWGFVHAGSPTNNRIYINLGSSGLIECNVGGTNMSSSITVVDGQWYHVALSHNSLNGRSYIYVNGKLANSAATALGTGTYDMYIGSLSASNDQTLKGKIDDLRFYTRFMTEAEIRAIMHGSGYSK